MNNQWLTLADLVRLLDSHGMNRSLIQRYDAEPSFREVMQKDEETKTYPGWTLPIWEKIAAARVKEPLLVRPKLAARYVKPFVPGIIEQQLVPVNRDPSISDNQSDITRLDPGNSLVTVSTSNRSLPESFLTDEQIHRINDRVLTAQEAAEFLRISIQHLKDYGPKPFIRYGKSARGDRWRLSDLLR